MIHDVREVNRKAQTLIKLSVDHGFSTLSGNGLTSTGGAKTSAVFIFDSLTNQDPQYSPS
jgi:hypothetical protein